ncbi:RnfABCDGE type electron transport complex subunit D [Neobacillus sp. PS2-9]|uniref:RnfABCDGE type electron transport complex subunit D n=1 Tax=Neobacillus sp. PS2-9 TaxID=3070676 RepID=UPI0027E0B718|nr:RnfABCDGE type electron transport complex subunit D [Neobacillus sp. PS2-9]WML57412.1 RnfABCDGE type electron transport complex subunit D [Neobacillus sp. PS2-9]
MRTVKWMKTPKGYVTISLITYLIIASIGYKTLNGIRNALIAVVAAFVIEFFYSRIINRKSSKDGVVITGLIISLVLSITTSWPYVVGTAAISILSKHLLVFKKKPIFNPAAIGLFVSVFIFHIGHSWWGAFGDLPWWLMMFLLIGGYIVTDRVNKFPQVFAFLGTFFVLLFFMGYFQVGDAADALRPPFINATIFFGLFMLTDPPTSPAKYKNQILFGVISAVSGIVVYGMFGGLTYLFFGLFMGNLYNYWNKRSVMKSAELKQQRMKNSQRALYK